DPRARDFRGRVTHAGGQRCRSLHEAEPRGHLRRGVRDRPRARARSLPGALPGRRMSEKSNVQAVHDTLLAEFRRDERYILMGEDVGVRGALYHSQSVEAFYAHVPGLKVVVPSTPRDITGMLRAALRDPDPVIFLEHKATYRAVKGEVPDDPDFVLPLGPADVKREGTDITVFAYGLMLHHSLRAADELAKEGVSANVVDVRSLRPLDAATIV